MNALTLLLLAAVSVYANSTCYLPAYDQLELTFLKSYREKENDKDKDVWCYALKHKFTPTKADLYKSVQCDKEYYVATFSNTIGSFNSWKFPSDKYAIQISQAYENDKVEGKLRAIKMTAQKVELNKEVVIEGEICVQKIPQFNGGDKPIAVIAFVESEDLEKNLPKFTAPVYSTTVGVGQTTTTTQNGNTTIKKCTGQGNTVVECNLEKPGSSVKVTTGGDGEVVIVTTSNSGRKLLL